MKTITEMTTAEMIAEYNALTGKNIKKFSSRAAGEKQLAKVRADSILDKIESKKAEVEEAPAEEVQAEEVQAEEVQAEEVQAEEVQAEEVQAEEVQAEEVQAEEVSAEDGVWEAPAKAKKEKTVKAAGSISEGVKASWKNPDVAAARAKRDAVSVEGKGEYKSVPAAFKALGLSMAKMIKFRMELKAKGTATYGEYKFTIVGK